MLLWVGRCNGVDQVVGRGAIPWIVADMCKQMSREALGDASVGEVSVFLKPLTDSRDQVERGG